MSFHDRWTLKRAQRLGGKITEDNSKMPGTAFAFDARQCKLGQVLHKVSGTTCADCNMLGLQKRRSKVQLSYERNQRATELTLARFGPVVYGEAHAYQILDFGYTLHRWLSSGDLPSPLMLDAICHSAQLTPHVTHWVATRELKMVLDWWEEGGAALKPDNVIIRVSQAKIDAPPINNLPTGILTSTTHEEIEDRDAYGFACPALLQDHKCGTCRACWDASIPNVSYRMHPYGNPKRGMKSKQYGEHKWLLFPDEPNVPEEDMVGDEAVLKHPIFEEAFAKILELHKPASKIALLSLCAASNDQSPKWKKFVDEFSSDTDLIVCSNAGVVPYWYWTNCWPYRSYDALRKNGKWDRLYMEIMYERLMRFFAAAKYDYVIANFVPTKARNLIPTKRALRELEAEGRILGFSILPQWHTYDDMRKRMDNEAATKGKKSGGTRFPDIQPEVMAVLEEQIKKWSYRNP